MRTSLALPAALAACALLPAAASAQATRTWSSGVGDDVNPCSRTQPCKTFAGQISKTAAAGEMNVLDSAGYGTLVITKAITLDGAGAHASILNATVNGIIVNAGSKEDVVLRNLSIDGGGEPANSDPCLRNNNGRIGIRILKARSVRIENVVIERQRTAGITIEHEAAASPDEPTPSVFLNRVDITGSCGPGVRVFPVGGRAVDLTVRDSTVSNTTAGLQVESGASAWLTGSTIFDNDFGLKTVDTGALTSYGDNQVHANGNGTTDNGAPTTDLTPKPQTVTVTQTVTAPPTTVPGPTTTVTVPAPTVPTTPIVLCKVPRLTGLTRATATSRLKAANCAVGKVTLRKGRSSQRGKVISADTKAGTKANKGEKVALVVGR